MKAIFKILSFVLSAAIFIPTASKLAHVLENIDHEICEAVNESHYHELEIDCEFEKFNLSKAFSQEIPDLELEDQPNHKSYSLDYSSLLLSFELDTTSSRGPPVMI